MRGATARAPSVKCGSGYFNPRAPCGARPAGQIGNEASVEISIHAPHAGRDLEAFTFRHGQLAFQSTRPMRGAT